MKLTNEFHLNLAKFVMHNESHRHRSVYKSACLMHWKNQTLSK